MSDLEPKRRAGESLASFKERTKKEGRLRVLADAQSLYKRGRDKGNQSMKDDAFVALLTVLTDIVTEGL